jgi:hypothetical protein
MCSKKKAAAALIILLEEQKREKTIWTRNLFKRRTEKGHYENLVKELSLEDSESYRRFLRMDTETFNSIVDIVRPDIQKQMTLMRETISPEERVSLTLRFLATGDSYQSLSFAFRISPSSISHIIPEVCEAIYNRFKDTYLKVPSTQEEWKEIAHNFSDMWNFPNCLGAVDGKHVVLNQPSQSGSHFHNYKGTFSIVLMAVSDAEYKFIFVDVGTNGRISDGGVWNKCALKNAIESGILEIPDINRIGSKDLPHVFVGDEAFPLKKYLMKPYSSRNLNDERRIFNYRLSRARRVVENAFGILTSQWRVYRKPIALSLENSKKVVLATIILHNLLRSKSKTSNNYSPVNIIDREDITTGEVQYGFWRQEEAYGVQSLGQMATNFYSAEAKEIRDDFTEYFNNEGQVSWQSIYSHVDK